MGHSVKILLDSISVSGHRITTFQLVFPRIVLAEFNTHKLFSRNSASSRAIPVEKMIKMVEEEPYIPTHWGKNQKGMQAKEEVNEEEQKKAEREWIEASKNAVNSAKKLLEVGIHKQITNRLLEPFLWHTVICTATDYENWEHLRNNEDAHPEIRKTAEEMSRLLRKQMIPTKLSEEEWHLPLVKTHEGKMLFKEDLDFAQSVERETGQNKDMVLAKISAARCARVSYLTHEGKREPQEDLNMYDKLRGPGHMSPMEHPARPMTEIELDKYMQKETYGLETRTTYYCGNFQGWVQLRKHIPYEWDILGKRF